jgi:hypothetical protein
MIVQMRKDRTVVGSRTMCIIHYFLLWIEPFAIVF